MKSRFWFIAFWLVVAAGVLFPVAAMADDCLAKYERSDYPHWGPSEKFDDIRQETIAKAVVADLVVEDGRVVAGLWFDPFTGQNYRIQDVKPDVDHLASLGWIHDRGGACMTREQRRSIANDPENLWAVHPSANRQKGANVSGWLPANFGMCTAYVSQLKRVVEKYDLKLSADDVEIYNITVTRCQEWRNGIRIEKAKTWVERWFE